MRWAFRESFVRYIHLVGGEIRADKQASWDGAAATFAPASPPSLDAWEGRLRIDAHDGAIRILIADPHLVSYRGDTYLAARVAPVQDHAATRLARLLAPEEADSPLVLTMDGVRLFGAYEPNDPFGSLNR